MKHFSIITLLLSFFLLIIGCSSDDSTTRNDNNSFLPNTSVNFSVDLNLVSNSALQFNGGELFLSRNRALGSIEGVYIFRANSTAFFAFELAEPNHPVGSCTLATNPETNMPVLNERGQFEYTCGEERTFYERLGQRSSGETEGFPLRQYTVFPVMNGNTVVRLDIRN